MKQKTIGQKIKDWRKKKNLTQDELAKKAQIPYPTLIKIEINSTTNPCLFTVEKIAKGLNISVGKLLK